MKRQLITERRVREAHRECGQIRVDEDAIFTPAARDAVKELRVEVLKGSKVLKEAPAAAPYRVVGLAADHGGVLVKEWVGEALEALGVEYRDHGVFSATETCDYPDKAAEIAQGVQSGRYWRGVVVDGAGIGSAIVANKFTGIRAGMVYDTQTAQNARAHNNVNVITLGGQLLGKKTVLEIIRLFITTDFEGGRHQRRVDKIEFIEAKEKG